MQDPARIQDSLFSHALGALELVAQRAERSTLNALREAREELLAEWHDARSLEERDEVLETAERFVGQISRRNAANAEIPRPTQHRLRDMMRALIEAYGLRPDVTGPNSEQVPYLPMPFAEEMIRYFGKAARYWLDNKSIPAPAKQPTFIKNNFYGALGILGKFDGEKFTPSGGYEQAPAHVAAKAPVYFAADKPAGKPHAQVVKGRETWSVIDRLMRLAIHIDVLGKTPTKLDLAKESVMEAMQELPITLANTVSEVAKVSAGFTGKALKWAGLAVLGLGGLYVVTRAMRSAPPRHEGGG